MKNSFYSIISSVIGSSHILCEMPNQDNIYLKSNDEFICISVADGLGSCSRSHIGSRTATKISVDYIIENIQNSSDFEVLLKTALQNSIDAIRTISEESGISIQEYATTLILAIITKERKVYTLQTGDGGVIVFNSNNATLVNEPIDMEYKNMVVPITSSSYKEYTTYCEFEGEYKALAIFTDGIESFSIKKDEHGIYKSQNKFWVGVYGAVKDCDDEDKWSDDLSEYLRNNDLIQRHSSDDKTLGIILFK